MRWWLHSLGMSCFSIKVQSMKSLMYLYARTDSAYPECCKYGSYFVYILCIYMTHIRSKGPFWHVVLCIKCSQITIGTINGITPPISSMYVQYATLKHYEEHRTSRSCMHRGMTGVISRRRGKYQIYNSINDMPAVDDYDGYDFKGNHKFDKRRADFISRFVAFSLLPKHLEQTTK